MPCLLYVSTTNGDVMKIFMSGATGTIGSRQVAQLVACGQEAVGVPAVRSWLDADFGDRHLVESGAGR